MRKLTALSTLFIIFLTLTFAQRDLERMFEDSYQEGELVTLSESIPFNKAIEVLSGISEKITGQKIVSTVDITSPIGIAIPKLPYKKALLLIVQYNGLMFEEKEDVIIVKRKGEAEGKPSADIYASVDSREVKISALFFEANISDMRERGINWDVLLEKTGIELGAELITFAEQLDPTGTGGSGSEGGSGANQQQGITPEFTMGPDNVDFEVGDFSGNASAIFKFFETNDLGEIVSNPSVVVRDNTEGRIQIGSDISIKQRDFAGNVTDFFISTGIIINVRPHLYREDGIDYCLLSVDLEQSSANPGDVSTEIKKTRATTEVLMLDGEETVIGGLYIQEEVEFRRGIPFLKDLPWWVFGIRYLTGYEETTIQKKEVVILLELEILPTLKERVAMKKENVLREAIDEMEQRIERNKLYKIWDKEDEDEYEE
jgi:type IV pilus assembly protein PilQ